MKKKYERPLMYTAAPHWKPERVLLYLFRIASRASLHMSYGDGDLYLGTLPRSAFLWLTKRKRYAAPYMLTVTRQECESERLYSEQAVAMWILGQWRHRNISGLLGRYKFPTMEFIADAIGMPSKYMRWLHHTPEGQRAAWRRWSFGATV